MYRFNGVVLAGGQSSRMGRDKALLEHKGESLLSRSERLLKQSGADSVYISRNTEGFDHIHDHFPGCGPLAGIHAAMERCSDLPLLIIPVDLPLLIPRDLILLVKHGYNSESNCQYQAQNLPIFIHKPGLMLHELEKTLLDACSLSVGRFFARFPLEKLRCRARHRFVNTNTPDEWKKVQHTYACA